MAVNPFWRWLLVIFACLTAACSDVKAPADEASATASPAAAAPAYSSLTILPNGSRQHTPLAPGMLVSVYGERLGPETPCTASADPDKRETPSPQRPNQTLVETQVFPERLCDTEVRVGGIAAGVMYAAAGQINFKVPQQTPVDGTTTVQVSHKGRSGPAVTVPLGNTPLTDTSQQLAERIWSGLEKIEWEAPYRPRASRSPNACAAVVPHQALRGGLYGYAFHCMQQSQGISAESFYYAVSGTPPALQLRRSDFRLVNASRDERGGGAVADRAADACVRHGASSG
ncbi:MAG: hypothetical protein ACRD7E_32000 [Bryobacteraceae bacterium]